MARSRGIPLIRRGVGLYYHHLLIPGSSGASATIESIGRLFRDFEARGAPDGRWIVRLSDFSARQKLKNPFTGEELIVPKAKRIEVGTLAGLLKKAKRLEQYEASFFVDAAPGVEWFNVLPSPPSSEPRRVGATVCVFPTARPTSTEECFGKTVEVGADHRFSHPETGEELVVRGAGSARFWIEVVLGKFEVPRQVGLTPLDVAPAWYVTAAEHAFQMKLIQGAQWG